MNKSFPKPETKTGKVLAAFISGNSYNRFEAEQELHDHCLHSTVSVIQRSYGIRIQRKRETVPCYQGNTVSVCRYWIPQEERRRIDEIRHSLQKEKAQTTSDQTNEKGFLNSEDKHNANILTGQLSLKYVR